MAFSLATLNSKLGPLPAVEVDGKYYRVEDVVPGLIKRPEQGLLSLFENWMGAEYAINRALDQGSYRSTRPLPKPTETQFLAPILYPSKIICTGVNYYDHLRDDVKVLDFDKSKFDILYFLKHSHALVGAASGVRFPSQSKQFDWEVELAVVFGKSGRRIPADKALDYVAGYCIGLDLTARDWQTNPRHFRQFDLMAGKSFDDSSPLGPRLVPARFVDPTTVSPVTLAICNRLDLFTIWYVVLLGIGMHVTGKVSKLNAAIFAVIYWSLVTGFALFGAWRQMAAAG